MDDDVSRQTEFSPSRAFPSLRLLRGVGLALDGRKMILGALGAVLTWVGWTALSGIFESPQPASPLSVNLLTAPAYRMGSGVWPALGASLRTVAEPIDNLAAPFLGLFQLQGGVTSHLRALGMMVWAVLVWGIIGAAIARITLLQIASQDRIGVLKALRFGFSKIRPLLTAPLGAFAGVLFFGMLCGLLGLLYRIPGPIGVAIAGALAFLPLLAGLVMSLILVGLAAGWPLMVATIAAEGEDAFDALSRSYSYVYQRPLRYALDVLLAWLVGAVGFLFVLLLARLVVGMALWGLAIGGPSGRIVSLFGGPPEDQERLAGVLHLGWVQLVSALVLGWVYSYFWSAAAQIYLLLRHDVDGAAFDDIVLESHQSDRFAPELPTEKIEAATLLTEAAPGTPDDPGRPDPPSA